MIDLAHLIFWLENDKDTARVSFMMKDIDAYIAVPLHNIKTSDNETCTDSYKVVKCNGSKCPLCKAGYTTRRRLFVPLYNHKTHTIQFWPRPEASYATFENMYSRYKDIRSYIFEIKRHGKKFDPNTSYEINVIGRRSYEEYSIPDIHYLLYEIMTDEEMNKYLSEVQYECEQSS